MTDTRILAAKQYAAEGRDWHIDAAMSEISVQFALSQDKFIAQDILPIVPVAKQSDKYYVWSRNDWFRIPNTRRARATAPKYIESGVSSLGYFAENYMLGERIPFEDLTNADAALQREESAVKLVTQLIMLDQENRVATLLTTAANVGSGNALTGVNRWNDRTGSDPVSDVTTGKSWIQLESGQTDLTMVVGQQVHDALLLHPDIHERVKYVARADQANLANAMADIFGVKRYLIGKAVQNTAAENLPGTMAYVWGKNVVLIYTPDAPALNMPSGGYMFRWRPTGFSDFVAETRDDEDIKARIKRVGYFQDEVVTSTECTYLLTTVVD